MNFQLLLVFEYRVITIKTHKVLSFLIHICNEISVKEKQWGQSYIRRVETWLHLDLTVPNSLHCISKTKNNVQPRIVFPPLKFPSMKYLTVFLCTLSSVSKNIQFKIYCARFICLFIKQSLGRFGRCTRHVIVDSDPVLCV